MKMNLVDIVASVDARKHELLELASALIRFPTPSPPAIPNRRKPLFNTSWRNTDS